MVYINTSIITTNSTTSV